MRYGFSDLAAAAQALGTINPIAAGLKPIASTSQHGMIAPPFFNFL